MEYLAWLGLIALGASLWLMALVTFTRRPKEPINFFKAYKRRVYVSATIALALGLVMNMVGMYAPFGLALLGILLLVAMWSVPWAAKYALEKKKERHDRQA